MFSWLKNLISDANKRKKFEEEVLANLPSDRTTPKNELPLDPKNDPWGRR